MRVATGITRIFNGDLIDGTGRRPSVTRSLSSTAAGSATPGPPPVRRRSPNDVHQIDASGGTIMPGLVEAHFHATYFNVLRLEDLDIKYPVEMVTLLARSTPGWRWSAATRRPARRQPVQHRRLAEEGDRERPRPRPALRPSGREICGVGGLMDWNPDFRKIGMEGVVLVVNGPDEARSAARRLVKDGVEWVKTYPTGDAAAPDTQRPPHALHDVRGDARGRARSPTTTGSR